MTTIPLENGGLWIEGTASPPSDGATGPLVIGRDWLLEMVRTRRGSSRAFFWAPFAIVSHVPDLDSILRGRFVGFSTPTPPPCDWLATSMTFDLGTSALARTPQELIALVTEPRPYQPLENASPSRLSREAKRLIATTFTTAARMSDIATRLGVSHAHLTRQFKADYGLTPVDFRHRLRVSEAMNRLSRGEKSKPATTRDFATRAGSTRTSAR